MNFLVLFFFLTVLYNASALSLPSDFSICKRTNPKINDCLKSAVQDALTVMSKGLPDFKLDTIEPIKIPSLTIGEGKGAVHVVQNYKNVEIHNIAQATVKSVESTITDTEFKLNIKLFAKEVYMIADYNLNGNILVVPIVGEGDCKIALKNTKVNIDLVGEYTEKNGKKYLEIVSSTVNLDAGKAEFDFKNLFNGDAALGIEMNKLLNENWKELYEDVKPGYEEALGEIFKNITNVIIKRVPFDEMFPK